MWFKKDPRVANVRVLGGLMNRQLMTGVPAIVQAVLGAIEGMDDEAKFAFLSEQAANVNNTMPPRENPRLNISVDSVHASGPLARSHVVIYGNCSYKQTGLLNAYAAHRLVYGQPRQVGFASACQAFGHRELFSVLKSFGLVQGPVVTVSN